MDIRYPGELPVSAARDEILAALRAHQVVIVAGETGSGKTTQLPKMCLELGRGVDGLIGHTQPRRIAARAVAERIAEELGTPLGTTVGYKVRFTDSVSPATLVKVMTDGILLAEIQRDRTLSRYDTVIVDEAHERSLNIDFLLGFLKQLLPRRPDLKLVITSATIDTERFSRHFGDAPVVEVSGRTYPVEVRYRPLLAEDGAEERDQIQGITDAVEELRGAGPGDILVFLSGEREIRDTADALRKLDLRDTEVIPLYARLSAAEQHKVFERHSSRRIVLATNVAETSLTVPGIRYVVDPGTARISRYSSRLKVQRLPIEAVSQASANQRKGRCGRVADGICIRLYSEEDFLARPEFTEPEILRTNLASVLLQMTALGLGDVAAFPFVDPPDRRNVRDGMQLLEELGALPERRTDERASAREESSATRRTAGKLTDVGRRLAQLPIDPRFGRMVLEADRLGCVAEVAVIAAALSIQDPRERPADKQQAADEKHVRFRDTTSDFASYLNLWRYVQERQDELSSSAFRRLCKSEYLHYLRIREWQDLHGQLLRVVKSLGITPNTVPADGRRVTTALLSGLLSHVGLWDPEKREYLGARGARFAVFPASALFRKPPRWVMAAELVETSRLWGRICAQVAPEDVEPLAGHLVKRTYSEPHWSKKRAAVMAYERVTLYGLPLVVGRAVTYGRIDPAVSRDLFLRHALVEGDWDTHHRFLAENRRLLEDVEELEQRVRRRGLRVDNDTLFDFYAKRVPESVISGAHFDRWWKQERRARPDLLTFDPAMLLADGTGVSEDDHPGTWHLGELHLPLTYVFDPQSPADGVTVHIPVSVLNQVDPTGFDWLVPGLREELVTALLRSLPKELRRSLVPVPDTARAALAGIAPYAGEEPLTVALGEELYQRTGVDIPDEAWRPGDLPGHLRMTFLVEGEDGTLLAEGKDLEALQRQLRPAVRDTLARAAQDIEQSGLTDWTIGTLPHTYATGVVTGFPALVDEGETVGVSVLGTEAEQRAAMRRGTRRLLRLTLPSPVRSALDRMTNADKLALSTTPHGNVPALLEDCQDAALDELIDRFGGPAWDEAGFAALRDAVRAELAEVLDAVVPVTVRILAGAQELRRTLREPVPASLQPAYADMQAQLSGLVYAGFVTATGVPQLPQLPRYLRAIERRLSALQQNPGRDGTLMTQFMQVRQEYDDLAASLPEARRGAADVRAVGWMLEEWRVSLFAQTLGTAFPVSEKRILRAMDDLA